MSVQTEERLEEWWLRFLQRVRVMRVQTEEWQTFVPGVRMYKGKKTLFYNGEVLYDFYNDEYHIYDKEERQTWQVIIVLPGVEIIHEHTFKKCYDVQKVIMANDVRGIGHASFADCLALDFVHLSRNLEIICPYTFSHCANLSSIFIPSSCRLIGELAFWGCNLLFIFNVPQHAQLGSKVFCQATSLARISSIDSCTDEGSAQMNAWVKSINDDNEYVLHRLCSSMDPSEDEIYQLMCEHGGPCAMAKKNSIGVTPSEYLAANPYTDVDEKKLMKRFVLEKMGEIV